MKVKLGDVVNKVVENVDRLNTDLVYYIGGEHINSESICIYNGGLLDSDKGKTLGYQFQFRFQKDDVLFMTKNPYLKKCAKVCFDGICSIATFVLRTKDDGVLLQYFLPVLLQTSDFWNYLEANKSGSVNYFITWKTLSAYEFELPTIEEQRRIADLAWSIERTKVAYENLLHATDELVKSQFMEQFGDPVSNTHHFPVSTLKAVANGALSYGSVASAVDYDGETRYVRITDISDDGTLGDDVKSAAKTDTKYLLHEGDILFARTGATVGKTCRYRESYGRAIYAGFLIRLIPNTDIIDPDYLFSFTKSDYYWDFVKASQRVVAQPNINAQEYGELLILLPNIDLQKQFAAFVRQTDKSKFELTQALEALNATYKKLISENLG